MDKCEVYGDNEDCENDESGGDDDAQANANVLSFLTLHQVMENEQGRYVSMDLADCDVSNNSNPEDPIESSLIRYHLGPSP